MSKRSPAGFKGAVGTAKILTNAAGMRHDLKEVFADFVSLSALTLRNSFEPQGPEWDARQAQHDEIVSRYDAQMVQAFRDCLSSLTLLAAEGYGDHLGELYMSLGISKKRLGQVFTPYGISLAMARMAMNPLMVAEAVTEKGFVYTQDPACGAGSMIIAAAQAIKELGLNPAVNLRAVCLDLDPLCCKMSYVACVLHDIPATIIRGDTLKFENLEEVHTPALIRQMAGTPLSDAA